MAISDNTDYNEAANIAKVSKGLNGAGGNRFRNVENTYPKFRFEDDMPRSNELGKARNDIPKLPIMDSWKTSRG